MNRLSNRVIVALFTAGILVSCGNDKDMYTINVPPTVDVVSGADIAFKAIGGEGYIEVAPVDGQLQVSTDQSSWCHLTAEGNRIHVSVDGYSGLESRYAKVMMKAGDASGVTVVHQFGIIVREFAPRDVTLNNDAQDAAAAFSAGVGSRAGVFAGGLFFGLCGSHAMLFTAAFMASATTPAPLNSAPLATSCAFSPSCASVLFSSSRPSVLMVIGTSITPLPSGRRIPGGSARSRAHTARCSGTSSRRIPPPVRSPPPPQSASPSRV